VLLLEEVHFLSGKDKIQSELGYTLDALANDKKKIIFTSSMPPRDIPDISKELSSRLTSGLVTTIGKPNYETRIKIFEKKSSDLDLVLSEEIIHFLASRLTPDIRQMESALNCLKAKSELLNEKINLDLAKDVVSSLVSSQHSTSTEDIKNIVCKYFKIDPSILQSRSRKKAYTYPRNIYVYLCRKHTDETLENIAGTINRSHSSVLYASELVGHKMKSDNKLLHQVNFLSKNVEELVR
jgi:chromosomal replication initiator protein